MSKKGWRYSIRNDSLPVAIYGRNKIAPTPVGGDGGNGGNGEVTISRATEILR